MQFWAYIGITTLVLLYLLWPDGGGPVVEAAQAEPSPVQFINGEIRIAPDSPLLDKLQTVSVAPETIASPVVTVTGTVAASLRPGRGGQRGWQFDSPELLSTYTDWQKSVEDIAFSRTQLDSITQLAQNRVAAQQTLVQRLEKLVAAGTDTEQDLVAARTELLQAQIEGNQQQHEAETALRLAERSEAALSRQLQQAGLEPELLRIAGQPVDIVVADVPEAMITRVQLGQGCEARFLGIDGQVFSGTVRSISPVLSEELRSLRVQFEIDDPQDRLRPGMFADIGLGTDAREAILAPIDGVVHVGRADYMLVRGQEASWRIATVQVGELHDHAVEILDGLQPGDDVMGAGAILLKPFVVEATQAAAARVVGG
ncbi:MAG: efflux RND transporter periplasmic adaptor subunit [Pseudomonadota bacterium]